MYSSDEKVFNSANFLTWIKLFKNKYSHVDINDIVNYAGMTHGEINDPLCWFTHRQADRFYERVSRYFDDPLKIAREAGHYTYEDLVLNPFKKFTLKLFEVGYIYKNANKYSDVLTKTNVMQSQRLAKNKYKIIITFTEPHYTEPPWIEQNRMGVIEGVPLLYSEQVAKIERYPDGRTITYIVTWGKSAAEALHRVRRAILYAGGIFMAAAASIAMADLDFFLAQQAYFVLAFFCLMLGLFGISWLQSVRENTEIKKLHVIREKSVASAMKATEQDFNGLRTLKKVSETVIAYYDIDKILSKIAAILAESSYEKIAFYMIESGTFKVKYTMGYSGLKNFDAPDDIETFKKLWVVDKTTKAPFPLSLIGLPDPNDPVIYIPIIYHKTLSGFMLTTPGQSVSIGSQQLGLLQNIGSHIAMGFQTSQTIKQNQIIEQLIENDKMKSAFISTASHELKTPIQILMIGLEELELSRDIDENLPILQSELDRLQRAVKDILNLDNISRTQKLQKSLVGAADLIHALKKEMLKYAAIYAHQVKFEIPQDFNLLCDRENFSICLLNLFYNACKYTGQGGNIIVRARQQNNGKIAYFSIIDNGIGVPEWAQQKIFYSFFQADRIESSKIGGSGLGLSIAQKIARLHNGDIFITSPLDKTQFPEMNLDGKKRVGSEFKISLPGN